MPPIGSVLNLGPIPYREAWELQQVLVQRRRANLIPDTLILLEHPPVYTIGRSGHEHNVLLSALERLARGIDLVQVDRGGDVTYHGPGQLVGYPIVDLRPRGNDVHRYLREIESVVMGVLADYGLAGERDDGYTGVWIGDRKIAAIGVKVTHGVTSHGFALNVCSDLDHWAGIVPCGISQRGVVNLDDLVDGKAEVGEIRARVAAEFGRVFGIDLQWVSATALGVGDAITI